jgi:hypothetical protein
MRERAFIPAPPLGPALCSAIKALDEAKAFIREFLANVLSCPPYRRLRKDRERQRHAKRLTATAVNPHKARRPAVSINGPAAGSQCMPMRGVAQIISERGIVHAAGRDNTADT